MIRMFWISFCSGTVLGLLYDAIFGPEPLDLWWAAGFALNCYAVQLWWKDAPA